MGAGDFLSGKGKAFKGGITMTNRQIPCEMIQDILPLYAESLTSEVTNREVESHLADCEMCRENKIA